MIVDALYFLIAKTGFIGIRLFALYAMAASSESSTFGGLALAFTIAEVWRFIADWGADTYSLRVFSNPDARLAASNFAALAKIRVKACVLGWSMAYISIRIFTDAHSIVVIGAIAFTTVTSLWLNLGINWLQARATLRTASKWLLALALTSLSVQTYATYRHYTILSHVLLLIAFELLMCMVVVGLSYSQSRKLAGDAAEIFSGMQILRQATPIAVASLIALAYSKLDQFLVQRFSSSSDLGEYLLSVRLVEPFLFAGAALASTIYARVSSRVFNGEDAGEIGNAARKWSRWMLMYGLGACVVMAVFAEVGLPVLFASYPGAKVFVWFGLGALIFRCLNLCFTAFIQATGNYRTMLKINAFNFVMFVTLSGVLGNTWGVIGVAVAVVAGEMINTILQSRILKNILNQKKTA